MKKMHLKYRNVVMRNAIHAQNIFEGCHDVKRDNG